MAIDLVLVASSQCQWCDREGIGCSMAAGTNVGWTRSYFDCRRSSDTSSSISFRCRNPLFGALQSHWSPTWQDLSLYNVRVAADDYSDSASDSFKFMGHRGYHPLEELKRHERKIDILLTDAEIARTTVEANSKASLVFPGRVHCEPHEHVSWADYQYIIDDYGDIFFEIFDDDSIMKDRYASNPVTVLIGMDNSLCGMNRMGNWNYCDDLDGDSIIEPLFDDDYDEIVNTEVIDTLIRWGMPETMRHVHPIYFSKCLAKSVHTEYEEKMDFPSNGISILGCLRPAFIDEESDLRRLFHHDSDGYSSDWRDESEKEEEQVAGTFDLIDGEIIRFDNGGRVTSTFYKLEVMSVELFSIYGVQSTINSQDFQDVEPDLLARSASAIIERFNEYEMGCTAALKALCRKRKGLVVEKANLIGVDSLGMDVRVSSGLQVQTLRFSFNARAMSESAAEKKIKRMLFPRHHRKSSRTPSDGVKDLTSL